MPQLPEKEAMAIYINNPRNIFPLSQLLHSTLPSNTIEILVALSFHLLKKILPYLYAWSVIRISMSE
jgi:hypothetical protein